MPTTCNRKQRELAERESLILDCAQHILHRHGYTGLTMERVAESVEYSKGTIYNHFSSKEDMVCSLCCRCISKLIDLFERASRYPGNTRQRFSAIGIAYTLYHQLHPLDAQNIQIVKTHAVRNKISQQKRQELNRLEQHILEITLQLVNEAVATGDLPQLTPSQTNSLVFGAWSMHFGSMLLQHSDIPLTALGFSPVADMTWQNSQRLLDGYNWKPLSMEDDTSAGFQTLMETLFADEIALLNTHNNQEYKEAS